MATLTHLDTHVVAWLYAGELDRLSKRAADAIRAEPPAVSPMVELELTYLREIGRLRIDGPTIVASLAEGIGLIVDETGLRSIVAAAQAQTWTRDPFDRLIAAHAIAAGAQLLSADGNMLENVPIATWD